MVRPEINAFSDVTLKIRKGGASGWRWIATRLAPGPAIRTFLDICNSPLVRVTAPVMEKVIVSPGAAAAMAARNEPGPASAGELTVAANPRPWCRAKASRRAEVLVMFVDVSWFRW